MAFILLTALYVLIDVTRLWNGAPFRYVGELGWNEEQSYLVARFNVLIITSVPRPEFYSDLHGA